MARFSAKDSRYRQAVLLRDVPWAIPLQDINSALAKQGIATGSVERWRQYIRVEVIITDKTIKKNEKEREREREREREKR